MIVKRNENNGIIECLYQSSNVIASKYNPTTEELYITFQRGATYKYDKVPLRDYTRFEIADSQGTVLNSHIKKYTFTRMPDVNAEELIKEIELNRPKELSTAEKLMLITMENFVMQYKNKSEINMADLTAVELSIAQVKETKKVNE